jgi:hypothetical protein
MYVVVMSTGNGITTKVASFHDAYLPDIPPNVTEYAITARTSCEAVGCGDPSGRFYPGGVPSHNTGSPAGLASLSRSCSERVPR